METNYKILIPTDFSSVATTAIAHAKKIAAIMKGEIIVLHVVGKDSQTEATHKKLNPIVDEIIASGIPAQSKVVSGDFLKQVPAVAEIMEVQLIIMGTHGRRGIQHLIGSYAMKIITSSAIPFIVVQDRKVPQKYENIVFPIDLSAETKLKLEMTASMAKHLGSTVHIFAAKDNDPFNKKTMDANAEIVAK